MTIAFAVKVSMHARRTSIAGPPTKGVTGPEIFPSLVGSPPVRKFALLATGATKSGKAAFGGILRDLIK